MLFRSSKYQIGESGLLALDWWNGNKTPYVNGNLSGMIIGMTLNTKPEEIYRALIESTAFGTKVILNQMEESGVNIDEIVASGGIIYKNPLFMQIYTDVLGIPIKIAKCKQAAALGASIYAAIAAGSASGGFDSYEQAVMHMSGTATFQYKVNPENVNKYNDLYRIYLKYSDIIGDKEKELIREFLLCYILQVQQEIQKELC